MGHSIESSETFDADRNIEHNRNSKTLTANNYGTNSNFPSNDPTVKMENLIKSEKVKSFNEKSECTDQRTNDINSIDGRSNHGQLSGCYPSGLDPSAGIEQSVQSDDFYFRNYSHPSDITRSSTASYANEMMANRSLVANYEYSAVRSYENAINGIPSATPFDRYDMNLGNLYASSLPMQRPYPSYFTSFGQDDASAQQKYFHDHPMLKSDHGIDNSSPYYPKPMYHYDHPSFPLTGFSAMNLTLRSAAVAAAATNSLQPIMSLSTPSVTSSNLLAHNPSYYTVAQRTTTDELTPSNTPKPNANTPSPQPNTNANTANTTNNTNTNDLNSDGGRGGTVENSKNRSYRLNDDNLTQYQNSRSPQSEPVDLCNAPLKPNTNAFSGDNNSVETVPQNRPFSRESTSDSNASPYVDSFKGDPMSKWLFYIFFFFILFLNVKTTAIVCAV